jgi:hypothetical protein
MPPYFTLPGVESVLADAVFSAQLGLALLTTGCFLQYAHDLLFTEPALLHD